ncbi:MAG: Hsp20 family protein [Firmicutes bacterium]|nr:Hsp20 family protein [Bacillota bacterium]
MPTYDEKRLLEGLFELQKRSFELWQSLWPQDLMQKAIEVLDVINQQPEKVHPAMTAAGVSGETIDIEEQRVLEGEEPLVHITESGKELLVTAALPGLRGGEDLSVKVGGDVLTLRVRNRAVAAGESGQGDLWYTRQIRLPAEVEADGATARYQSGVLALRLPKKLVAGQGVKVDFF